MHHAIRELAIPVAELRRTTELFARSRAEERWRRKHESASPRIRRHLTPSRSVQRCRCCSGGRSRVGWSGAISIPHQVILPDHSTPQLQVGSIPTHGYFHCPMVDVSIIHREMLCQKGGGQEVRVLSPPEQFQCARLWRAQACWRCVGRVYGRFLRCGKVFHQSVGTS